MKDRLEQLRLFFPAEVTGAYLSIKAVLENTGSLGTENMEAMLGIVAALIAVNVFIYVRVHGIVSPIWHAFIAVGFFIWVLNIDMDRYVDLILIGPYIELAAPISLIFYTLVTTVLEISPKGSSNA